MPTSKLGGVTKHNKDDAHHHDSLNKDRHPARTVPAPFTRIPHACKRLSCHKHIGAPPKTIRLTSLTSRSWIASRAPIASTPSSIRTSSQTATTDVGVFQGPMSTPKEDSHHQGTPKQDSHTSCKHMRFFRWYFLNKIPGFLPNLM